MTSVAAYVLGMAMSLPALTPAPPAPPPDPFAKGYMGIWFTGAGPSLGIDRVEPNQPAAKAGIQAGDVIVRVNHLVPQGTQDVINYVCKFRPGALIEVEVQRGDERKVFKMKLGTRPSEVDRSPIPNIPP